MAKIKICGLRRNEDIEIVNRYKPDYAGFIVDFPKSFRSLTIDALAVLTRQLDGSITPVGVFVDEDIDMICKLLDEKVIAMAQLHGHESDETVKEIQSHGYPVIKAFTIHHAKDMENALRSSADYILLDQGKGSGKTFDWNLIGQVKRPYFLAGGLSPDNIEEALALHPYAIDLSSGVETNRFKDEAKIKKVIEKGRQYE